MQPSSSAFLTIRPWVSEDGLLYAMHETALKLQFIKTALVERDNIFR